MKKTVAIVKLAPGNSGFFDPLTGLHLTLTSKVGYVYDIDDTTNIRVALKKHTLELTGGVLPPVCSIKQPVKERKIILENDAKTTEINITEKKEEKIIKTEALDLLTVEDLDNPIEEKVKITKSSNKKKVNKKEEKDSIKSVEEE